LGEMTREEIVSVLRRDNPSGRADDIAMYADCFLDYAEAQRNIAEHGNIVSHPRTGQPIENPYIKVKTNAMNQLRKINALRKVAALWSA